MIPLIPEQMGDKGVIWSLLDFYIQDIKLNLSENREKKGNKDDSTLTFEMLKVKGCPVTRSAPIP